MTPGPVRLAVLDIPADILTVVGAVLVRVDADRCLVRIGGRETVHSVAAVEQGIALARDIDLAARVRRAREGK